MKLLKQSQNLNGNLQNQEGWNVEKIFPMKKNGIKGIDKIKQVRPIFMEEAKEIIVITVYTYFY